MAEIYGTKYIFGWTMAGVSEIYLSKTFFVLYNFVINVFIFILDIVIPLKLKINIYRVAGPIHKYRVAGPIHIYI